MPAICKTCPFFDSFWDSIMGRPEKEKMLLKQYYRHAFAPGCLDANLKLCSPTAEYASKLLLQIMLKYSCAEIIEIISEDFTPFPIASADIPQFSDLTDCYYGVPDVIIRSGLDSISYEKMGFLLRHPNETRNKVADTKYGENQGKTAFMMGLCTLDSSYQFHVTPLGEVFAHLDKMTKDKLLPKFCLYIPMIQNYYMEGAVWSVAEKYMSILKESTFIRRRPNVKCLLSIIDNALKNEFQGP